MATSYLLLQPFKINMGGGVILFGLTTFSMHVYMSTSRQSTHTYHNIDEIVY